VEAKDPKEPWLPRIEKDAEGVKILIKG